MSAVARPRRRDARVVRVAVNAALVLVTALFGVPFLWVIAAALDGDTGSFVPWPSSPTLANFADLFQVLDFGVSLRNSLIVSLATMVATVLVAALAGHALSRLPFWRKDELAHGLLLLQALPLAATMVPIYDLTRRAGLRDSYLGLILTHTGLALPLTIWLMKGFVDRVPVEVEEAAALDGAGRWRIWWQIVLPLVRPGLAIAGGLAFLLAWSEVLLALVLIDDPEKETVALTFYRTYQRAGGFSEIRFEVVAAMGVLYIVPVLAVFVLAWRWLVGGLTAGSMQGE